LGRWINLLKICDDMGRCWVKAVLYGVTPIGCY
jgi:hypothetical protein